MRVFTLPPAEARGACAGAFLRPAERAPATGAASCGAVGAASTSQIWRSCRGACPAAFGALRARAVAGAVSGDGEGPTVAAGLSG